MNIQQRYLHDAILEDLREKMVFISGPRQVGKTTLALAIAHERYPKHQYLNWDKKADKRKIFVEAFLPDITLLILDEIHKYHRWKNHLKGIYDTRKNDFSILVTGSARLDIYRKGGDSMMGRYYSYRLHPFSVRELMGKKPEIKILQPLVFPEQSLDERSFEALFRFGGFPEPLFSQSERVLRRWHRKRAEQLVQEDIRSVERVQEISLLEILVSLLPERVGSRLSLNNLRQDLDVSHKAIALWMNILERFYYHFRIKPFVVKHTMSLKKEPKLYLWDWSEVEDPSVRLENMVASHLLKFCHFMEDTEGYRMDLHYLRDRQMREVDFLVTIDKKPWFMVEVKRSDTKPSSHLKYFQERLNIPLAYQVVLETEDDVKRGNVRVMGVRKFLSGLV